MSCHGEDAGKGTSLKVEHISAYISKLMVLDKQLVAQTVLLRSDSSGVACRSPGIESFEIRCLSPLSLCDGTWFTLSYQQ